MLLCSSAELALSQVHALLGVGEKSLRQMEIRACQRMADCVEVSETFVTFGTCYPWADVEADGAAFRYGHLAASVGGRRGELGGALAPELARGRWAGVAGRGILERSALARL